MKLKNVAAQLYTVREHLKTPADIARSLAKIRKIGYTAVQVSGLGPIEDAELARLLDGEGLTCCATHDGNVLDEPEDVAERLDRLGCTYTAYPYPGGVRLDSVRDVKAFAKRLNRAGQVLARAGKGLAYHNHHIEFKKIGGRPILELIYAETNPRYLLGEIDTYWVQYGGGDPAGWCAWLTKRLPLLHMKDFGINNQNQIVFTEIGSGNLGWKRIVAEAEKAGCRWFIVEQDVCPVDPFVSLKISYDYIRKNLCT